MVAATIGTGDSLVSGASQGDTWHLNGKGHVIDRQLDGTRAVLSDRQVKRVVKLVRAVSDFLGRPQDIEWAYEENRLYLLQSRDITAIHDSTEEGAYALWDNSNIVESYGGVTTPLTFSVARSAYQEAYRHMGRALGVSEKTITQNERAYEQMIGLMRGRVYYNLLNWYRLLMLTPGFRFNRRFMEQMMGVTTGLPESAVPKAEDNSRFASVRAGLGLARVAVRLVAKLFVHNRHVRGFHRTLDELMQPVELGQMSLDQLIDYYETLQSEVIPAWDTPLINDLYCMIFHGALRQLSERWLTEDMRDIHNDLVAGEAGIISLEPVQRMQKMAMLVSGDASFVTALCSGTVSSIEKKSRQHAEFTIEYEAYIERFGDRCLDELKLESQTLGDDPLPLLRAVGQLARSSGGRVTDNSQRSNAEDRLAVALRRKPLRRLIFAAVLNAARARVRDRENLRFERTRVYGRVRAVFIEIAGRLKSLGAIEEIGDIFYLDVTEITAFIRGTGINSELSTVIAARKKEFDGYRAGEDPPRRFVTCGPAQLESSMQVLPDDDADVNDELRHGQACSAGKVCGPVRIVRDPRDTDIKNGEILVAQRTDPGWVTIFPLVTGMIMERGSLLSHSAIVARELGIPAVVGVDNACRWLKDGDWVELDGASGVIRRLEQAERAA